MSLSLNQYRNELAAEFQRIISFWILHAPDEQQGGFLGRVGTNGEIYPNAPKGSVLNARILWTFSAGFLRTKKADCLAIADRAFDYIDNHFIDPEYGGVYWTVDASGHPLDTKKQVYALAFTLYGCSEYYKCRPSQRVLDICDGLFAAIETNSYDAERGGYFEAFTRNWGAMSDLRLSGKDANEKKTMNTHLHVLEAYSNFYDIAPGKKIRDRITGLLGIFLETIVNKNTGHLDLFFDENWELKSDIVSYGHDIEAAWLLLEAAEKIGDFEWISRVAASSIRIAGAVMEGMDADGGLWYEQEIGILVRQKHWWPQAEAMIGFFNAWQLTGDAKWLEQSIASWNYIKAQILDQKNGEWFWGIGEDGRPMLQEDKIGLWKCPYHNGRACLEIIKRIDEYQAIAIK